MNNSEIQIQFPRPGEWGEFTLTAIYQDKGGYRPPARYTPADIPADHAPAMQAVVAALVGLGEDWQAVQVWARLGKDVLTLAEDGAYAASALLGGCGHSVDVTPEKTVVCKDGSCLVIEQGHISYSQAQPETDVPPVVQSLKK